MKNAALLLLVLIFFSFSNAVFSSKSPSLSEKLMKRNTKYPTGNFQKVIQFGPRRTGSTLVYNILRYLFENDARMNFNGFCNFKNKVIKTHTTSFFNKFKDEVYFVTFRDPQNSIYSLCKAEDKITKNNISKYTNEVTSSLKEIDLLYKKNKNVVLLKYEDFVENMDVIFIAIEKAFSITIDEKDKSFLRENLSKQSVIEYSKNIGSFDSWDNLTHIHGKHIHQEEKDDPELRNNIYNQLSPYSELINKLGYKLVENTHQIIPSSTSSIK